MPQDASLVKTLSFGRARASISLRGGHVMHWVTEAGHAPLYLSPDAVYRDGKAIRGGIPVCWPQFSDMGPLPAHGFARTAMWRHLGTVDAPDHGQMTFLLDRHAAPELPGAVFEVALVVTLRAMELGVELRVRNNGIVPLTFTTALHTYYAVSDIEALEVYGLDAVPYADNLQGKAMQPAGEVRTIASEVDRNYYGTDGAPVELRDVSTGVSTVVTASESFPDSVLWNPWVDKAQRLADLPDDGFRGFVCLESGAIRTPVTVAPDQRWSGKQVSRIAVSSPPPQSNL